MVARGYSPLGNEVGTPPKEQVRSFISPSGGQVIIVASERSQGTAIAVMNLGREVEGTQTNGTEAKEGIENGKAQ